MLQLAKAGVDYIRKNAFESNGGVITYWDDGIPGPPESQRNSQDLAYAALGLSSYYYITRDNDVLQDIIKLKNYIFSNYYNSNLDMMMFTKGSNSKKLIAQLDQLNTYMVLVTLLLPKPIKAQWKTDLLRLLRIMINKFYSSKYNLFWREGNPGQNFLEVDFGHTIKAFWMIYLTSKLTNDSFLRTFVEAQAPKVLEKAYIRSTGSWGTTLNSDGSVNGIKISWMYNELDQTTATLSLKYPSLTQYLTNTYKYWFRNMVDYNYYETWPEITASGGKANRFKVDAWNHGYHAVEHTLVGYITSQTLHREPVILYYAFKGQPLESTINPYFYSGQIQDKKISYFNSFPNHKKYQVTFGNIQ